MTLTQAAVELQRIANAIAPGHCGGSLTLYLPSGPVTVGIMPGSAVAVPLSEGESEIIEAFDGSEPGTVFQVAELAKRIGCEPGSNLRERLGRLVRIGRLVNKRPGYQLAAPSVNGFHREPAQ